MDILSELLNWLAPVLQSPMSAATIVVAITLGYLCKAWPKFPNELIPHFVVPAAAFLFAIVGDRALVPDTVPLGNPRTVALAMYGVALGFVAWLLYAQVIRRLEDKFSGGAKVPLLLLLAATLVLPACSHLSRKANAFATLEATQAAIHEGMNGYGRAFRAGRVDTNTANRVRQAHNHYAVAFDAAVITAKFDLKGATPDSVRSLATDLLNLIQKYR